LNRKKPNKPISADVDLSKRNTLRSIGGLAAYVAPAMTVLVSGDRARAHHRPGHVDPCKNFPNSPYCTSTF
jgi:hypothetical protein